MDRNRPIAALALLAAFGGVGPATTATEPPPPAPIARFFGPPPEFEGDLGPYRSPLLFDDGRAVKTPADWSARRAEIKKTWFDAIGAWPPLLDRPKLEVLETTPEEKYARHKVRVEVAREQTMDGYLLIPDGKGPFPAMLVVFYEPETAVGDGKEGRDFARQLARNGYAALSIGVDPRAFDPATRGLGLQPLSYLGYVAANAGKALADRPEVSDDRVGVMGHSYGGKWAMFAACLDDRFACGVWSDPGVAFDEARGNVNYWEPWYLGWEPGKARKPGLPTASNPRTGPYNDLIERGHDLHELQSLMAPRPFLVSGGSEDFPARWKALNHPLGVNRLLGVSNRVAMTNRPDHSPNEESNAQILAFLDHALKGRTPSTP